MSCFVKKFSWEFYWELINLLLILWRILQSDSAKFFSNFFSHGITAKLLWKLAHLSHWLMKRVKGELLFELRPARWLLFSHSLQMPKGPHVKMATLWSYELNHTASGRTEGIRQKDCGFFHLCPPCWQSSQLPSQTSILNIQPRFQYQFSLGLFVVP